MFSCGAVPAAARRLLEQRVDLGVGDADARLHLALAHALDQHLVAHVVAKARVVDAFAAQPLAQLRHRELVLRRHVGDRAVELGLVDAACRCRARW